MQSTEQAPSTPAEFAPAAASAAPGRRAAAKVLVVDDEPFLRNFMRLALERGGYTVSEAANGEEGLRAYASFQPDCVIMDLLMPKKEGIETIMEMRQHPHKAHIIAISGGWALHTPIFLRTARHLGADATLHKPFSVAGLLEVVGQMVPPVAREAAR